jgi:ABC-type transport system substrate-binding protein
MARRIGRRSFLARGAGLAAGAVALGAGGEALTAEAAGARTNGPGRNGIGVGRPVRGGDLVFGVDAEEQGFDPTSARFDEVGIMYARTVFDPLTIVLANGGWAPYLAQSVVPNQELTSWTVTLRPNLMFHDGTPCDANALQLNYERQHSSPLIGPAFASSVVGTKVVGPLSVQVDVATPWAAFPYYLATQVGFVAAPSMLNNPDGTTHPVGTGPFTYGQWDPNNHFTARRNPHYWRPGLPYLDSITYRPIIDPDARSEALQAGTVDLMVTNTPQTIVLYRGKRAWSYVDDSGPVVGEPDINMVMLNTSAPPFNNPTLRKAMAMSVDRAQYARIIDLGINAPVNGPYVPGTPWYTPNTGYPEYNPAEASRLVRSIQHQTGKPVSFTFGAIPSPEVTRAAEYLISKYTAVGLKPTLATIQQSELINNALTGKFQAVTWRQFGTVDPDLNYVWWSTTSLNPGISLNMARNNDPKLQQALMAGRTGTTRAARVAAYKTVSQRLGADLPYLWGDRSTWAVVANPKVQNFNNPTSPSGLKGLGLQNGAISPTQIWIKK